jgi:hypothetical protein
MLCIEYKTDKDGYTVIRITDAEGTHASLCGFDRWAFIALFEEYSIQL